MSILDQVALGYPAAKKQIYDIMLQYYPKVDKSRSTLLNAFVSGVSYIYSMFQVFATLLRDELYVSEARELNSLYKLIPLVGIQLAAPVKMSIAASMKPQDETVLPVAGSAAYPLYITGNDPFTDSNGYKFQMPAYVQNSAVVVYSYADDTIRTVAGTNQSLDLSLGRWLGNILPLSKYTDDSVVLRIPYIRYDNGGLGVIKLTINSAGIIDPTGSTETGVVVLASSSFNAYSGYLHLVIFGSFLRNDGTTPLAGQSITVDYRTRSEYRKNETITLNVTSPQCPQPQGSSAFGEDNIADYVDPIPDGETPATTFVRSFYLNKPVNPLSVKLQHQVTAAIVFDFSAAEPFVHPLWGTIYQVTCDYNSETFYATLLDASIGLFYVENPAKDSLWDRFALTYTTVYNNRVLLEQYENKSKTINPATEINFANLSYTLEDDDILFFNDCAIKINDAGFTDVIFTQVPNVSTVLGTSAQAYFEVTPLGKGKAEIRFDASVPLASLTSITIAYKVGKDVANYASGTALTGTALLVSATGVPYDGIPRPFSGTNQTAQAGIAGVPVLATLRSTLEKAAYTYDNYVTRQDYEGVIQLFFISKGQDARIRVFDYSDFGSLFLDSTAGNIVFFMGVINAFPATDPVLSLPYEISDVTITGGDRGVYTRAELAAGLPVVVTDISTSLPIISRVTGGACDGSSGIREILKPYSCMTNYLLADERFVRMYALYFVLKVRPANQYTFAEASIAVKQYLASLFSWSKMQFIRDINLSDVYRALDELEEVDKVFFTNFSHYPIIRDTVGTTLVPRMEDPTYRAQDINYRTLYSNATLTGVMHMVTVTTSGKQQGYLVVTNVGRDIAAGDWTVAVATRTVKHATANFTAAGFTVGMSVKLKGFTLNTDVVGTITLISSDGGTNNVLTLTDTTPLVDETQAASSSVYVKQNIDLRSIGVQAGSLVAVSGFSVSANNKKRATVVVADASPTDAVTEDRIVLDPYTAYSSAEFVNDGPHTVVVTSVPRIDNPVWDFSTILTDRLIKVDVLALGGIETTPY